MNKGYVVVATVIASMAFANAEGVTATRGVLRVASTTMRTAELRRGMPVHLIEGKVVGFATATQAHAVTLTSAGRATLTEAGSVRIMQGVPQIVTGDPAIDAQVKTLTTEMETKIKAIQDDYMAKIKAVVGNKAIKTQPGMMASTTIIHGEARLENSTSTGSSTRPNFERGDSVKRVQGEAGRVLGASAVGRVEDGEVAPMVAKMSAAIMPVTTGPNRS